MILADTSVWVAHLRRPEPRLIAGLNAGEILMHSFVIGELALGSLRQRTVLLRLWRALPAAATVADAEVLRLIAAEQLGGTGIGYIDAHLLAATRAFPGARLWTRDQALRVAANRLGLAAAAG